MGAIQLVIATGVALASLFLSGNTSVITNTTPLSIQETTAQKVSRYKVATGDTFSIIMEQFGLSPKDSMTILETAKDTYDFSTVKIGQYFIFTFIDDILMQITYDINDEDIIVVRKVANGFTIVKEEIIYEIKKVMVGTKITTSLFIDALKAGLSENIIIELADVFGWDIDFATDIQKNDSFSVIYEKRFRDGKEAKPGRILAAQFKNNGEIFWAFFFKDGNGKIGYYNEKGRALARQFLKSPLNYSYISSGFTYKRFHPILKKTLAHRAIDYVAPYGTPAISTASGKVIYAGWNGGNGRTVRIRHANSYTTMYAHLSGIAKNIRVGTRVKQGQIIGFVGSSGFSTGAHLHYEFGKNGILLNPLNIKLPLGNPLDETFKKQFDTVKEKYKLRLLTQ